MGQLVCQKCAGHPGWIVTLGAGNGTARRCECLRDQIEIHREQGSVVCIHCGKPTSAEHPNCPPF